MQNIAVLGLGHMGAPIAARLADQGFSVTAWNRTPGRTPDGVAVAGTAREAAAHADLVITMLTDGPAVAAVAKAAELRPGTTLVDMSTIGPAAVRELAAALPEGVSLVDAPVGGSVGAAAAGELRIFVGGAADDVDRVEPVLSVLGRVRRCGVLGTGAAVKLVLNTALVTAVAALADVLAVASSVGVDREEAVDVLRGSPLGTAVERTLLPGGPPAHFAVALAAKDLGLALAAAGGRDLPVAAASGTVLAAAPPGADLGSIVRGES